MHRTSCVFAILLLVASALAYGGGAPSPVGLWRVFGDKSGEAEALVRVSERDGVFEGMVVTVFARPGVDPAALCELCPGERKNRPVQGMTILTGLRRDGAEYGGGVILDPDSGELYRCKLRVSDDNLKLHVRGFIGIPLVGRTQTWVRE